MDSYFENTLQDVLRWEYVENLEDLATGSDDSGDGSYVNHGPQETVHCLQRDYISVYGSHPKMEDRIYNACGVCEQIFNPRAVAIHKEHCPGKGKVQSHHLKKKVKSKKKLQVSSVPLPPLFGGGRVTPPAVASENTHFFQKETPGPPVLSKFSDIPPQSSRLAPEVLPAPEISSSNVGKTINNEIIPEPTPGTSVASPPTPTLQSLPSSPLSKFEPEPSAPSEESSMAVSNNVTTTGSLTNSRHKKSKKNTKALREYDPDIHCGVIDGQKGPCTRSITCSNHKIQLRKSVLGRSKNIHVLIAEKKATKEKDTRQSSPTINQIAIETKAHNEDIFMPVIKTEPVCGEELEQQNEVSSKFIPTCKISASSTTTTAIAIAKIPENELHDEVESDDPSNQLESGYCSVETSLSTKSSPVLYFNPISPIFVVTPVQFIQKENTVFVEATQRTHSPPTNGYFLTMPESSNIKLYKSHPKPTILPTYGTRKVGGAILSSNQRLEYQRKDIQMAITTKRMPTSPTSCKTTSYNVPPQRSILQKVKGINKVNCKRASTEKINSTDSKQIKLAADVNGFILHTDMSEVADAPQPNHCIQENINLLNMK